MKISKVIIGLLVVLLLFSCSGEKQPIEHLKKKIEKVGGSEKVDLLNELSIEFLKKKQIDSLLKYGNIALDLSENIDYKKGKIEALNNIGGGYYHKKEFEKAIQNYDLAYPMAKEMKNHKQVETALVSLAMVYGQKNNIKKSLKYYEKVANYKIKNSQTFNLVFNLSQIMRLRNILGLPIEGFEKLDKGIALIKKHGTELQRKKLEFYLEKNGDCPAGEVVVIGLHSISKKEFIDTVCVLNKSHGALFCNVNVEKFVPSSSVYMSFENYNIKQIVTVIDPKYKNLIKKKVSFSDSNETIDEWEELENVFFSKQCGTEPRYISSLKKYNKYLKSEDKEKPLDFGLDPLCVYLSKHNTNIDKKNAIETINNDDNYRNRIIAVATLINFIDSDDTWWTLMDAMRGTSTPSRISYSLLKILTDNEPKKVDWKPILPNIKYLVDGTNLYFYEPILEILQKTGIEKNDVKYLLKDGTNIIFDLLECDIEKLKKPVHDFLTETTGEDFGYDSEKWIKWVNE